MVRLTAQIQVGKLVFDFVHDLEIERSYSNLTDTAKIILPKKVLLTLPKKRAEQGVEIAKIEDIELLNFIQLGDKVEINLGYDHENHVEFRGFVTNIENSQRIVIECEDFMYKMKFDKVGKSWRNVNLFEVVEFLAAGQPFEAQDIPLARFRIAEVTAAKVFETLKRRNGIFTFFDLDGKLFAGLPNLFAKGKKQKPVVLKSNRNIISDNLQYTDSNQKTFLKATAMQSDGSVLTVELGEKGGNSIAAPFSASNVDDLKQQAIVFLSSLKTRGYSGTLLSFGAPYIQHGDVVRILNDEFIEREGDYLVEKTRVKYGVNGFRRSIKLGYRMD